MKESPYNHKPLSGEQWRALVGCRILYTVIEPDYVIDEEWKKNGKDPSVNHGLLKEISPSCLYLHLKDQGEQTGCWYRTNQINFMESLGKGPRKPVVTRKPKDDGDTPARIKKSV